MEKLTLEKALELSKNITPLNGEILVMNEVAPMVSSTGLISDKKTQEEQQQQMNKGGLLVIKGASESNASPLIGKRVTIREHSQPGLVRVITTEEILDDIPEKSKEQLEKGHVRKQDISKYYKKYLVLTFHPTAFTAIIEE